MIVDFEHTIHQPADRVFAVMHDIERRPEWVTPAVERTSLTDGPIGVGSRYQALDRYPGLRATFVQEITAYEPNRLLGESWGGPMAGHMVARFQAENETTKLVVRTEVEPSGALKLVAPLLKGWLVRAFKKDFVRLEQLVTAEAQAP